MGSLTSIAVDARLECFATETLASRALFETTNVVTLTGENMEVEYPDHKRSLYLTTTINGVQIRRVLVNKGAFVILIALSTF